MLASRSFSPSKQLCRIFFLNKRLSLGHRDIFYFIYVFFVCFVIVVVALKLKCICLNNIKIEPEKNKKQQTNKKQPHIKPFAHYEINISGANYLSLWLSV